MSNDLVNQERENISRKDIKKTIKSTLEDTNFGLNIAQLEEKLKLSRNTVKKYLKELNKESVIEMKLFGRSKVYYSKKTIKNSQVELNRSLIIIIINSFVSAGNEIAPKHVKDPYLFQKEYSKAIGEKIWPHLWPIVEDQTHELKLQEIIKEIEKIRKSTGKKAFLRQIADFAINYIEKFVNVMIGEAIKSDIPEIDEDNSSIVLRIQILQKEIKATTNFFYFAAGFYEGLLQGLLGAIVEKLFEGEHIYLEIIQIVEEVKIGYFKIRIGR